MGKLANLEDILLSIIERNPAEVFGKDETILDKILEIIKANKGPVSERADKVKGTVRKLQELPSEIIEQKL